ncbi:MAG: hypothetical protein ACE5J5_02125 [Candidatus Hydrothermarchaeales archaeon]
MEMKDLTDTMDAVKPSINKKTLERYERFEV